MLRRRGVTTSVSGVGAASSVWCSFGVIGSGLSIGPYPDDLFVTALLASSVVSGMSSPGPASGFEVLSTASGIAAGVSTMC